MAVKGIKASVGEICTVQTGGEPLLAEVVGFKGDTLFLMPLGELTGINSGALITPTGRRLEVGVGNNLQGRVLDGIGRVMDGPELKTDSSVPMWAPPPNPLDRVPIDSILETGIKAI